MTIFMFIFRSHDGKRSLPEDEGDGEPSQEHAFFILTTAKMKKSLFICMKFMPGRENQ